MVKTTSYYYLTTLKSQLTSQLAIAYP